MRQSAIATRRTRPASALTIVGQIILILGFANFTAVSAQLAVWLPFSPVPITAQTLAVLLAGVCLGARGGALAQLAYLAEGLAGLPVFAGGSSGLAVLLGPRGGYLVGFVVAAALVGFLADRGWNRRTLLLLAPLVLGSLAIYVCGAAWLSRVLPGGLPDAIALGVVPFLIGDAIKIALAAAVVPSAIRLIAPERR